MPPRVSRMIWLIRSIRACMVRNSGMARAQDEEQEDAHDRAG